MLQARYRDTFVRMDMHRAVHVIARLQNAARHRVTNWINPDTDNAGPLGPPDWNWRGLKPGDVTLAGLLRAGGYRTIHVGKGHFGPRTSAGADPRNLGFDVNV